MEEAILAYSFDKIGSIYDVHTEEGGGGSVKSRQMWTRRRESKKSGGPECRPVRAAKVGSAWCAVADGSL